MPVAFVVTNPRTPVSAEALTAFFHEVGPHYAYPRAIVFVEALPLNGAGKVDRHALTQRARSLVAPGADGEPSQSGRLGPPTVSVGRNGPFS